MKAKRKKEIAIGSGALLALGAIAAGTILAIKKAKKA